MADVRKPVASVDGVEAASLNEAVHRHLLAATEKGAKEIGCSGLSFVLIAMGSLTNELHELDPRATCKFLAALRIIFDPRATPRQKAYAEKKRAAAVRSLMAALDLQMNPKQGSA